MIEKVNNTTIMVRIICSNGSLVMVNLLISKKNGL